MHCVCGHPVQAHVNGGRCRVPDCPCEHFEPGETFAIRSASDGEPDVMRAMIAAAAPRYSSR